VARTKNVLPTQSLTLSTTPRVHEYLRRLVLTGLYGKNPAEAAERLLARSLEELLANGRLPPERGRPRD
jgi:hypothetical protein